MCGEESAVYPIPVRMRLLYSHFVIRQTLLLVMGALLTVSCGRQPGVYGAPTQRSLDLGPDPSATLAFVNRAAPQVDAYLVNNITPERGSRRWAFTPPEPRFRLADARHLVFSAE